MLNPNSHKKSFEAILNEFLKEEVDYYKLKKAIEEWKSILYEITELDLTRDEHRENIHSETGKAIGTTWAAMCLDDLMRTKKFVKGVFLAVDDLVRKQVKKPVQLLYAGCGPFAPLVLLLTSKFSPEQVKFSLLEINENSYQLVQKVFQQLDLEKYLEGIRLCDATTVQLSNASTFDLVISETMQHALVREQQVPITYNLLSQLREDVVLIPESIRLDIGLLSSFRNHERMMKGRFIDDFFKTLGTFFDLSKTSFLNNKEAFSTFSGIYRFPKYEFSLDQYDREVFNLLVVFTNIRVFGDECLDTYESQLTTPLILEPMDGKHCQSVEVNYKVDTIPGIEFRLDG
ncbi:MAG: hypothetical protein DWQ02_05070 [Bacteroidetes bacterium]|nr:MAG: hypothetical protein DWQ02_05070 [Bacteroidota bacterium]